MAPWLLEDVLLTLRSKEAFRRDSRVQEAGWGALAVLAADESAQAKFPEAGLRDRNESLSRALEPYLISATRGKQF